MERRKQKETLFEAEEVVSYEEIMDAYLREFPKYVSPQGDTIFGFWMQTLADLELLDLELQGLTRRYQIDPINRTVVFEGDEELVRLRIAHLERVGGKPTLYSEIVDTFDDTNAYAFHNLYPYKGKFYPRVVRTLINAFGLDENSLLLDPFNGSGTTTHEASLMGIKSVGIDITPMGVILAQLKNDLLFLDDRELQLSLKDLGDIFQAIERKKWQHTNKTIYYLMLVLYFDTIDAFERTSSYKQLGKIGLFSQKFAYIKDCYKKTKEIEKKYNLKFQPAEIHQGDVLDLRNFEGFKERFDAIITSPPYYFSIDYVGKDKVSYEYLGIDMREIEAKYLGMKNSGSVSKVYGNLPPRVVRYYEDLQASIENIFWALKPGGKLGIIVGDSTVASRKIPTTMMTKNFCEKAGFTFKRLIFNPLLGARNRAIRGESIIICEKP